MSRFLETLSVKAEVFTYLEPARLRAVWTAVVGLALALGVTIPADVDGRVVAVIAALAVLLPALQGERTRAKVSPYHDEPLSDHAGDEEV